MARRIATLRDALAPIIWLNCIFCMGIFEIPANRSRPFLTAAYLILMAIGYFIILYKLMIALIANLTIKWIIFYFVLITNILVATSAVILFWRNPNTTNIIIKRFTIADNTLEKFGVEKAYKRIFYYTMGWLGFWLLFMTLVNFTYAFWLWSDFDPVTHIYCSISFCFPLTLNSAIDITFATFMRYLKLNFGKINNLIENIVSSTNEACAFEICNQQENDLSIVIDANHRNKKEMVKHIFQTGRQLHLELTRIGQQTNAIYSVELLLELGIHFTVILTVSYGLYSVLYGNLRYENDIESIVSALCIQIIYSTKVIVLNNLCTEASNEAYKTKEIVQTLERPYLDEELKEEVYQFTQQIILHPLNFTAAGCFKMNNALTGKFFLTITTYLVILIQFSTPS